MRFSMVHSGTDILRHCGSPITGHTPAYRAPGNDLVRFCDN